jgi:hypothetical protein
MHVSSYPRATAWLPAVSLLLASFAGGAQAVEFDERVKAPMVKGGAEIKTQAEAYTASFARLSTASPMQMVSSRALAQDHFELKWQLQRAMEGQGAMEDLSALGLEKDSNGYRIDLNAFPQWNPPFEFLAVLMPSIYMDDLGPLLIARGFRDNDVAALRSYMETHDLDAATSVHTVPLAISFSKIVKKYDKIKRPVGKDQVLAFIYQRTRIEVEARRAWSEGLLRTLDDQRARILLSYFAELKSVSHWSPDNVEAGVAGQLALMRLPDYEQRVRAEAAGVTP